MDPLVIILVVGVIIVGAMIFWFRFTHTGRQEFNHAMQEGSNKAFYSKLEQIAKGQLPPSQYLQNGTRNQKEKVINTYYDTTLSVLLSICRSDQQEQALRTAVETGRLKAMYRYGVKGT